MAKNTGDIMLRDRMQFDLSDLADVGNRTTLYGRFDLSQYVDPVSRSGLAIKEVLFQPRWPTNPSEPNTGCFLVVGQGTSESDTADLTSALKLFATTRAYENASEVGIASPDVLCVYTRQSVTSPAAAVGGGLQAYVTEDHWYGPRDLHPDGYTVVSDLLIGVAADNWPDAANATIELDVVLVAESVKVTEKRMNEILSQQQDL